MKYLKIKSDGRTAENTWNKAVIPWNAKRVENDGKMILILE